MKRNNIKQGFLSLAAACLAFTACTGDFERFNTDPNAAQDVDLKMFITTMQMDAVYSCSGSDTDPNNRYQKAYNLIAICRDCWYDLYRTRKSLLENKGEMFIRKATEFCKLAIKSHYPM